MGFNLNKARAAKEEILKSFTPLELNEGNVQAIFNRCLATEETTEYVESILQQTIHGYDKDSNPILFDKQKLLENLKTIRYLYGQLATAHNDTNTINTEEDSKNNVMTDYSGKVWTSSSGILKQFFHLGVGTNTISPFNINGHSGFIHGILPTLSPKGPAFPAWWEAHKAEWEA